MKVMILMICEQCKFYQPYYGCLCPDQGGGCERCAREDVPKLVKITIESVKITENEQ